MAKELAQTTFYTRAELEERFPNTLKALQNAAAQIEIILAEESANAAASPAGTAPDKVPEHQPKALQWARSLASAVVGLLG